MDDNFMRIFVFSILLFISTNSHSSCEISATNNILGPSYDDKTVHHRLKKKYGQSMADDFFEMNICRRFNFTLKMSDSDKETAHYLYCNTGMRGYLPALHNCAVDFMNRNDKEVGIILLELSAKEGFAASRFILLRAYTRKHGFASKYVINELYELSHEIPEAKLLYDAVMCLKHGKKPADECTSL